MTNEQRAILDFKKLEGADAWYANAVARFGDEEAGRLLEEVTGKYREEYLVARAKPDFKTRAEREHDDRAANAERLGLKGADRDRFLAPAVRLSEMRKRQ